MSDLLKFIPWNPHNKNTFLEKHLNIQMKLDDEDQEDLVDSVTLLSSLRLLKKDQQGSSLP